jgi:hypothetical protein
MFKAMKTLSSAVYLVSIFVLGVALSCGGGSGIAEAETENITAVPAQGPRTSSDMNISPANMQAQDPMYDGNDSITRADSLGLNKPDN